MNKQLIVLLSLALTSGTPAGEFIARAKVIDAKPIIETVYETVEVCRYETRRVRTSNTGDKLVGGLLGGAAGSAVGKGSGRDAAAGVGALLGSELADGDGLTEGELLGGIVGGIVGNQLGKGSGKTAATGAGALIGSIVGDNIQHGPRTASTQKYRVCDQEERPKKIIAGYDVVYEYSGVRGSGYLSYKPDDFVDIHVATDLIEDRTAQN